MELEPNEKKRIAQQIKRIIHEGTMQIGKKTRQDFVRTGREMADAHNNALHRIAVLEKALWNTITIGHSKRYYKKRYYRAIEQAEKELEEENK